MVVKETWGPFFSIFHFTSPITLLSFILLSSPKILPLTKKGYITFEQAVKKLQHYCAYQDRCHYEVRSKLLDLGVYGDTLEEVIAELVKDNFLNEERYARSYARGKFRMKKWGKQKITRNLKMKKISAYCIRKAMTEIDQDEYEAVLDEIILNRMGEKEDWDYQLFQKTGKYVLSRGYESELVWRKISKLRAKSEI